MSDHISGPRALAEPIADITDVYAFPSPERPGHLVVVMNTLPFAKISDALSDGLIYRFRVRPLTAATGSEGAPFEVGEREFVFDCVFGEPTGGEDAASWSRTGRARRPPARRCRSASTTSTARRRTVCGCSPAPVGIRSSWTPPRRCRRSPRASSPSPITGRSTSTARTSSASSSRSTTPCSRGPNWSASSPRP